MFNLIQMILLNDESFYKKSPLNFQRAFSIGETSKLFTKAFSYFAPVYYIPECC